mgnify:FL=1
MVIQPQYKKVHSFYEGLAAVYKDGKWGFIDKNNHVKIKFKYEDITDFSEGLAGFQKNWHWGFIDKKGNVKIKNNYLQIYSGFSEGFASIMNRAENGGYIDQNGNAFPKFETDFVGYPFQNGKAIVNVGGDGQYYILKVLSLH